MNMQMIILEEGIVLCMLHYVLNSINDEVDMNRMILDMQASSMSHRGGSVRIAVSSELSDSRHMGKCVITSARCTD